MTPTVINYLSFCLCFSNKAYVWDSIIQTKIDYEEYKLLAPDFYKIDNQDVFLKKDILSNFSRFYIPGEINQKEWTPQLIKNHLCALESQKRVTNMMLISNDIYDFVIYLRPDVEIIDPFPVEAFNMSKNEIAIPNDGHGPGINDRFAIVHFIMCTYYGKRINEIIPYRQNIRSIVSERFVKYIIHKYFNHIHYVQFHMNRIRP